VELAERAALVWVEKVEQVDSEGPGEALGISEAPDLLGITETTASVTVAATASPDTPTTTIPTDRK
jgi:hypothetical protein